MTLLKVSNPNRHLRYNVLLALTLTATLEGCGQAHALSLKHRVQVHGWTSDASMYQAGEDLDADAYWRQVISGRGPGSMYAKANEQEQLQQL